MNKRILAFLLALAPWPAEAFITCSFNSTPGMAFGPYDDSSATPADSSTNIVVRCSRFFGGSSTANVVLQLGPGNFGTIPARQMRSGANPMNYNLYRDAARTQVWGQTSGTDTGGVTITAVPNNGSKNGTITIYGRIPALQNVNTGAYTDSVQMTISP